jgi:CRISPR-associated protein Cas2
MLGYGHRLQYSVFRCQLTERDIERMKWELARITESEDSLLVVSLCRACTRKLRVNGSTASWLRERPGFEII